MTPNSKKDTNGQYRLNKFVALALGVSRRKADELISDGKITVNENVGRLGQQVSDQDKVSLGGEILTTKKHELIILNKPVGYLCSRASQGGDPTVYDLIPKNLSHLKTVGRLDKDSSGLILMTNDGDFAHKMTHPSFYKIKRYLVTLDADLEPLHHQMINDFGVNLPDGRSQLTLTRQHDGDSRRWIVQMSEGRNRQIRRTFDALGYKVVKLHRTNFGNYALDDISSGKWRKADIS